MEHHLDLVLDRLGQHVLSARSGRLVPSPRREEPLTQPSFMVEWGKCGITTVLSYC